MKDTSRYTEFSYEMLGNPDDPLSCKAFDDMLELFQVKGHGYETEHSPQEHLELLKQSTRNSVGILIRKNGKPEALLVTLLDVQMDVHIRGEGIHGTYLVSVSEQDPAKTMRYLHKVMYNLCMELDCAWYSIPRKTGHYAYTLKYFKTRNYNGIRKERLERSD